MAVRVRINIELIKGKRKLKEIAVVNSAFESDVPELLLPTFIAEKLGLWPDLVEGTRREVYKTPKGVVEEYLVPGCIKVNITTPDKESDKIVCNAVISEESDEILINDKLGGRLGIVIEDIGKGIWRFRDEKRKRRSASTGR